MGKEAPVDKLEWKISVDDGTLKKGILTPESGAFHGVWVALQFVIKEPICRIRNFLEKAWNLGVAEPKKVIHGLKVGLALSLVSLFYYMRPLYDGFGGNAMWAVMTVVVVFEYTVGATLYKCINRATGTFLAGSLGLGIHWIASHAGDEFEPIILGMSVFILASAATFSRFIPSVKSRFDYGAMIFILTFSLVSISGYRVDKLFEMAHQRLSTIAVGASLCIIITMFFCPTWAGDELHSLIHTNLEKLADSLYGCVVMYFTNNCDDDSSKKMEHYKCVLNSKAAEESLANFVRWEPAHGRFSYRHPWKQYLKVGSALRGCGYCIGTINSSMNSEFEAPDFLKKHLSNACITLSSHASNVLRESATVMATMTKSSNIRSSVGEMQYAVKDLQNAFLSLPNCYLAAKPLAPLDGDSKTATTTKTTVLSMTEVLPLATLVSLLMETAARIEDIANEVINLAEQADFKPVTSEKPIQ
ncbi:hypothetical protein K2173_025208 [Erythroxylum novogranatense]|uniref:Aluminum-activated malate transporter 10 n=1 Tax=Erythroxylum novogranatense TaxID=1862640 RepID=A0AAV8UID8_9ROSI|nr:hypothetical protein K2173_025208 [Erythroxylum novogranatense]